MFDSSSQKFNSRKSSSQQPQENIVDRRENIMNNGKDSTEELNSFEEGGMHRSGQNTKTIE